MFKARTEQERNIRWGEDPLVIAGEIVRSNKEVAIKFKKEAVMGILLFSNPGGKGQEFFKPNKIESKEYICLHATLRHEHENAFHDLITLLSYDGGETFWLKYADATKFHTQIFESSQYSKEEYDVYIIGVE